jgi:hypothetical protein
MCKATTLIELDEPTMTAIRKGVKSLYREFHFVAGLGACSAVALSGFSYYFSGSFQMGQSLGLPIAIVGICGMMILTYATVSFPKKRKKT